MVALKASAFVITGLETREKTISASSYTSETVMRQAISTILGWDPRSASTIWRASCWVDSEAKISFNLKFFAATELDGADYCWLLSKRQHRASTRSIRFRTLIVHIRREMILKYKQDPRCKVFIFVCSLSAIQLALSLALLAIITCIKPAQSTIG